MKRFYNRQRHAVLSRLGGPKARRGTRHWSPPGTKSIDIDHVLQRAKWNDALRQDANDFLAALYEEIGDAMFAAFTSEGAWDVHDDKVTAALDRRVNKIVDTNETTNDAIRAAIKEGEANGETMRDIAKRVESVFEDADSYRAGTIARTEVTGARNEAGFLAADQTGVVDTKSWLSVGDHRTRESHLKADGDQVGIDDMFIVGGSKMKFPGDPNAPAEEVINCRCTAIYDVASVLA